MSFLSPALAWFGLAAAAIPIIIHLLNRRRFTRVDWAPMKYLKLTIKSNRRRLQIEQFLLLALRVLAMLLLFLTVARPMLSSDGLGSWLASGNQRKTRVIVIDDSLSMSETREDGTSVFQNAKAAATQIVQATNSADQLTLFVASQPNSPLARQAQIEDPSDLMSAIAQLKPTDVMNQWVSTFQKIDEYFEGAAYPVREAVLITDLRTAGWNEEIKSATANWNDNDQTLTVIDVGNRPVTNLSITRLQQMSPVALAGTTIRFEANVKNVSDESAEKLQATFYVDGQPQTVDLPEIKPGAETVIPLSADIAEPGLHRIRFELPPDRNTRDNQRFIVIDVRSSISILMVDGDPRTGGVMSETYFLAAACKAGRAPWQVQIVDEITDTDILENQTDVVVLANYGNLTREQVAALEKAVSRGMGLVIFAGELIDPTMYNDLLYKNGMGLLPMKLGETIEEEFSGLSVESVGNSPLDSLSNLAPAVLKRVQPSQVMKVENASSAESDDRVRVLAYWDGTDRVPALVEKRYGDGRVYFWTVTADRTWCNWQTEPSFVLSARQTMVFAATQSNKSKNVFAGQNITTEFPLTARPVDPVIEGPRSDEQIALTLESDATRTTTSFDETLHTGFYRIGWKDSEDRQQFDDFAVNPDSRECEPKRLSEEEVIDLVGNVRTRFISSGNIGDGSDPKTELWRTAAMIFLALIGCESLLAAWIGRER